MPKYQVKHDKKEWELEARHLQEAYVMILDREGYRVAEINPVKPVDYSMYWQQNPIYKGIKIGKSGLSFQIYGCFIHCLSFMTKRNPLEVLKLLVENGGINSSGLVVSAKAAELLGLELLKGDDKIIPGKMNDINYMPKFTSIKEVYLGKSQHFVVRLVDEKGNRSIFDPWEGKILPINKYTFKSYRLFKVK